MSSIDYYSGAGGFDSNLLAFRIQMGAGLASSNANAQAKITGVTDGISKEPLMKWGVPLSFSHFVDNGEMVITHRPYTHIVIGTRPRRLVYGVAVIAHLFRWLLGRTAL